LYSYTYDKVTGGLLLNSSPTSFSKEPRPVYAAELDILGFDKYWIYDKQNDSPYMWAEANVYWYRGVCVAKLKGGNVYTAPEIIIPQDDKGLFVSPEPNGVALRPIEIAAMVEQNRVMLEIIEQTTVKKILAVYNKYKNRLDSFHVAFSGGKDSCVLLDLVKKTLPKGSFIVVFGDTGMEFPDTYEIIEKTRAMCGEEGIAFYTAASHLKPEESWKLFGPPSRVLRWCCSVHKSAPQILKLREITGKNNYVGLDFVGVRSHESAARAEYEYENYGKKQKGQYSHNSILEWTSAEIWLYIYANDILINEAYKKGHARVGCILCPMSGEKSNSLRYLTYSNEIKKYTDIIRATINDSDIEGYVKNGGWEARSTGRDMKDNLVRYKTNIIDGQLTITVIKPFSKYEEWIKTVEAIPFAYKIMQTKEGYTVSIKATVIKEYPALLKLFKQVFIKAAYCKQCRVCETHCSNGCLSLANGIRIENCKQCAHCHEIPYGCLLSDCLKKPTEEKKMESINTFDDHAPMTAWIKDFFKKGDFLQNNTLGPNQQTKFKRFLSDAGLIKKETNTEFAQLLNIIGWETNISQALLLINLVDKNPQIEWYARNLDIGRIYPRQIIEDTLMAMDVKLKGAKSIVKAFKRLVETPLGTSLHFGYVTDEGELVRTKCSVTDPRIVLYSLFKFAEKCNDYREFTLSTLLNDSIERDGISPTRIFGLVREDMVPILLGLSAKYPDFITASFTHDLEKIALAEDKSSLEALDLFKQGD
jgi:phosphoadenosine phosphosulfate reductase